MSYVFPIAIGVLIFTVIGLIIAIAVILSSQNRSETLVQDEIVPIDAPEPPNEPPTEMPNVDTEEVEESKKPCDIKLSESEDIVQIGDPWYLSNVNPNQCFAPANQKCCDQIELENGVEGCMVDFTGFTSSSLEQWKKDCMNVNPILDLEKLEILSSYFSGSWIEVVNEGGNGGNGGNGSVKENGKMFDISISEQMLIVGIKNYKIDRISVNPEKTIHGFFTSPSETMNEISLESIDDTTIRMRTKETGANSGSVESVYTLSKVVSVGASSEVL